MPPLLTCWPVVTEAAWLLRTRPDTLHRLLGSFESGLETIPVGGPKPGKIGASVPYWDRLLFALLPLGDDDLPAIAAVMKRYESSAIQLADAALAHLAERENIRTVFTLDRRDFSIIRLKRNRSLILI